MTPAFRLLADAADITAAIADRLLSLELQDQAGAESDQLALTLDDREHRLILPRRGAVLALELGYAETGLVPMGRFTVDELELSAPPAVMAIRARSADLRASLKESRTRGWEEPGQTLGSLTTALAERHGLTPQIHPKLAEERIPYLAQTEESDLHLLTRLGRRYDATVSVKAGSLVVTPRAADTTPAGKRIPAIRLEPGRLLGWRLTLSDHPEHEAVRAGRHDPEAAALVEDVAGDDAADGLRLRHPLPSDGEAKAAARSAKRALQRAQSRLALSLPGDPALLAESRIALVGIRAGVDGVWSVVSARHFLGAEGYRTELEAEPAP